MGTSGSFDAAVVGAGVFGAWAAYRLRESGRTVALLDSYGPANSRASSGGESRLIRMGYGADEIYTRWAARSLALWRQFFDEAGRDLFAPTGVLWLARAEDPYTRATLETLGRVGVNFERLARADLAERFPQFAFGPDAWGVFEPDSGVLLARRAVQRVVAEAVRRGVVYLPEAASAPEGAGRLGAVVTRGGRRVAADNFVFACGPWLPKLFPALLGGLIVPTRQEVFFFGVGAGDVRFTPPSMPAWVDFSQSVYGVPDLEGRGVKLSIDRHGPPFDPDSGERLASAALLAEARGHLARLLPALRDAPVVEARVCQYENTPHGDFIIDRHPDFENVWLAGGGSGHGFKHGPAAGEYVAGLVAGAGAEPRFALPAKGGARGRTVY